MAHPTIIGYTHAYTSSINNAMASIAMSGDRHCAIEQHEIQMTDPIVEP
jgi:hypothetical protein